MNITPDQKRLIQSAITNVARYWHADTQTKEMRRRPVNGLAKLFNFIWPRRHKVRELYWWIAENWASERLIVFKFPMTHDNMPIDGFPMKFELQGGWTIPQSDLKYLYDGPLTTEGRHRILVPANLGWKSIWALAKQFAPVFTIIASITTIAVNFSKLREVWAALTNAA